MNERAKEERPSRLVVVRDNARPVFAGVINNLVNTVLISGQVVNSDRHSAA